MEGNRQTTVARSCMTINCQEYYNYNNDKTIKPQMANLEKDYKRIKIVYPILPISFHAPQIKICHLPTHSFSFLILCFFI